MSFSVGADEYDRFMGRYSVPLSAPFAEFAGVAAGQRALDLGCGPGALTAELVGRLGADAVSAVDPSERFVAAVRDRHPEVRVQCATAEKLPFTAALFDVVVVHAPMGLSTKGPEAEKEVWRDALRAMPDIRHDIQEVVSDGSIIAARAIPSKESRSPASPAANHLSSSELLKTLLLT